jgi:hypothetical protein
VVDFTSDATGSKSSCGFVIEAYARRLDGCQSSFISLEKDLMRGEDRKEKIGYAD